MKKKIALLIDTMNNGGAQRVVSRLSEILEDQYELFVILFEDTYDAYQCKGQVVFLNIGAKKNGVIGKFFQLFQRTHTLKKLKKRHQFHGVISFLDSPNFVNLLSHTSETKEAISIRNYSNTENNQSFIGKLTNLGMKLIYNRAQKIISVSRVIEHSLMTEYNLKASKLCVIYNPYDVEEINDLGSETLDSEHSTFFDQGDIIITVGRHMYQKGFWHLIKAFKRVKEERPNSKLVIVGRDEQQGRVQNLVNQLGLADSVLLLGFQKNPFKFIKRSKLYVMTSLFEGFPNALVEAMACGCPVVSVDCKSGPREILDDGITLDEIVDQVTPLSYGVLTPALENVENWEVNSLTCNEQKLSQAMLLVLEDEALRLHYGIKAKARAKDFSYSKCKEAFEKVIEEVF